MTENQTPKAKTVTTRYCNCGCGEATSSSKTAYKPGHDARHAGMVARAMAAAKINGDTTYSPALDTLPSPKLQAKAQAMAKRIVEQVSEKAAKAAKRTSPKAADRKAAQTPGSKRAEALIDGMQEAVNEKLAEVVAREEAEHAAAEAAKRAEVEAELAAADEADDLAPVGEVKVGRWTYPAKAARTEEGEVYLVRNTKRDGSGEWVAYDPR